MTVLNVTVENKIATADNQIIVCDNTDYIVQFTLDAEWDDYDAKTMRILYSTGTYEDIVFTGTSCPLPRIYNAAAIGIGIYAGDLHATVAAVFNCKRSVLSEDGTPVDPPEDVYNQIMEAINDGMLKGDTGNGIESIVLTSTSGNVDTYTITYTDETTTTFTVTNGSVTSVDGLTGDVVLDYKANIDGAYENMTVGNAEQLVATQYVEDKAPYVFRTSGGTKDIGNREDKTIGGGSVVWNQLCQNGNFTSTTGWTVSGGTQSVSNNELTLTINSSAAYTRRTISNVTGHKILMMCDAKVGTAQTTMLQFYRESGDSIIIRTTSSTYERLGIIGIGTDNTQIRIRAEGTANQTGMARNAIVCDLTTNFGSEIADRAYTLEQTTAGSGIAWLKSYGFLTKPYYTYAITPSLQSVKTSAHETIGFNQWDEVWEIGGIDNNGDNTNHTDRIRSKNYIPVLPNTTYYFKAPSNINIRWYDGDKKIISTGTFYNGTRVAPLNAAYLRFVWQGGTTYNNDICINLSWSGTRNGEYEAYNKHTYALDSSLTLRGIPKLDANNDIYFDGDTYASDGTVTRNYGTRAYQSGDESLTDAITDGTNTVYKLSTPTTEQADPFQSPMIVDDWGTERFVDAEYEANNRDFEMPVGHTTVYPANLRDKVQHLPELAEDNGDYIIRQTGTGMALVAVENELPTAPSEDGTYTLKATVSGGVVTYSWEA